MESTPSSSPTVHQSQQSVGNQSSTPVATMTPEQEQEIKLRSKYPNPQKPGSNFIQKMLHKGNRKYFDSGDYNMARSRCKANGSKIQTTTINQQQSQETASSNSSMFDSPSSTGDKIASPVANLSGDQIQLTVNNCPVNSSPMTTTALAAAATTKTSSSSTASTGLSATSQNLVLNGQYPSSPSVNCTNSYASLSSSVSTGSLMSQSLSQDKLSNIHLNTSMNNVILDSEEIGHGIPTPECIQSRKHSIAQSKLATPRLSTS